MRALTGGGGGGGAVSASDIWGLSTALDPADATLRDTASVYNAGSSTADATGWPTLAVNAQHGHPDNGNDAATWQWTLDASWDATERAGTMARVTWDSPGFDQSDWVIGLFLSTDAGFDAAEALGAIIEASGDAGNRILYLDKNGDSFGSSVWFSSGHGNPVEIGVQWLYDGDNSEYRRVQSWAVSSTAKRIAANLTDGGVNAAQNGTYLFLCVGNKLTSPAAATISNVRVQWLEVP